MKKKLLIILLALVVSMVIVFSKNYFSQYIPNKNFGITGLKKGQTVENLYIGSSMFKQGINPNYINDNDYIIAYNGNEPANIYREFKYLLSKDIKIKNLYIDMYVWSIARNPWIDDLTILWDVDINTINDIYTDVKKDSSFKYAYEYYVSANNDLLFTYPLSISIMNNYFLKGGNNYFTNGQKKEYLESLQIPHYNQNDLEFGQQQIESIKLIKQLCDEEDIDLIFIETPKYNKEANSQIYKKLIKKYSDVLASFNIKYILAEQINFDNSNADYFTDLVHMSSLGSKEYTYKLVKILAQ